MRWRNPTPFFVLKLLKKKNRKTRNKLGATPGFDPKSANFREYTSTIPSFGAYSGFSPSSTRKKFRDLNPGDCEITLIW